MFREKILVLGASGYIGSKLVQVLLEKGYQVRTGSRFAANHNRLNWANDPRVENVKVDVLDIQSLTKACAGCHCAYYLVHSMNSQHKNFEEADRCAAQNMVKAAAQGGLERIIYLGGLGDEEKNLSHHLRSRLEVSNILHSGRVPATTLRAAMVIGKGSASFEILRKLVERLPVMVTPRWVSTQAQPIAVDNVLEYLAGCLGALDTIGRKLDIGGADIVSYRQLMDIYCEEAGLPKRLIIPVPLLTPNLSSLWIGLITHYPSYIGRPLAEGLKNRVVCADDTIRELIPQRLLTCREAVRSALKESHEHEFRAH